MKIFVSICLAIATLVLVYDNCIPNTELNVRKAKAYAKIAANKQFFRDCVIESIELKERRFFPVGYELYCVWVVRKETGWRFLNLLTEPNTLFHTPSN